MSFNRVVWSEGLFLRPQHFQQQDRYMERFVETRCQGLIPHAWGFTEVELERDLLGIGKFGVRRASGVFPDGTPFRLAVDDPLPPALEIDVQVRDQLVYLAVPLRRVGEPEFERPDAADRMARHQIREWEARDTTSASGDSAPVEVGALSTRLLLASQVTDAYATIPIAHIAEARPDKRVLLDDSFMPTVLHARAATRLATFASELLGLLHQRGDALGGRVAATGRGAAAEFAEFLMLQAINRYEPLLAHHADTGGVHPEQLYELFVSIAGEMATFTSISKRPPAFPGYRHDRLRESFEPVMAALRAAFAAEMVQVAIPIPIETKKYGISVALVSERALYSSAVFVLAARADVPSEELRRSFPSQLKVGPVERIADLVRLGLPGVPVLPLPVAPRQIPFHAGSAYFELDQSSELWEQLKTSGGVALHVAGSFPGLAMEFWAIRT
ncbi:type VI secretion protein, family [Luteitalea pratensis]|uniref:Type VI secretion protein, family n=1 Tax=Luteitalea pratensis TaxID=1855912 RepID=A0A143PI63_LUTPR|nr:type VI secretion system baseplate subunit TssK [Luteitalea pratensis]AMY08106.1 type VI secretion protein, family [Luteitalea pratensis]